MFPLCPALRKVIVAQRKYTDEVEPATGKIVPLVFHKDGAPIQSFRKAWATACVKIGLGREIRTADGKLIRKEAFRTPHDFRRSAAQNLILAGVSHAAAMSLIGHKTESIFRRYAIADAEVQLDAVAKLAAFHEAQKNMPHVPKVAPASPKDSARNSTGQDPTRRVGNA